MKKKLTYIALSLAWPVLFYFAIGFIEWNLNSSQWSEELRRVWAWFGFAMCWVAPVFYHNNKKGWL